MALVPLSTKRLRLRGLEQADLEAVHGILGDDEATAHVSWRQPSRASTSEWLEKRIAAERDCGLSMWGIERSNSGELIGLCGFFPRADEPEIELGYVVKASSWGDGYGTEAVRAAVGAVTQAGYRVYATIRPWNVASIIVAKRAGLHADGEVRDDRGTLVIYRAVPSSPSTPSRD